MTAPLKVWLEESGHLLRLRLNRPKANIVDAAMIAALDDAFTQYAGQADLRAVLLDAEGPHFSFGASVEEHLPAQCADMIAALHGLLKKMVACPVPILVAAQGQCLGGGLEVAMAGNLIFAAPDAQFGQPEIRIGVFAPAASVLMPERIGRAQAEDLLFSGRSIGADEAWRIGLASQIADDPAAAALTYYRENLAPLSASSLRHAVRGAREEMVARVAAGLDRVERLYLDDLMTTADATEGLEAFIEKRAANWKDQ
jgi:cyclohexa-1,5-dienecarbonyl-CoA hydratase